MKQYLGLPISMSTDRLLSVGLHNAVGELVGHLSNEKARPAQMQTGLKVHAKLKWTSLDAVPPREMPGEWRKHITFRSLPKNMHPVQQGTWEARAQALRKTWTPTHSGIYRHSHVPRRQAKLTVVTTKTDLVWGHSAKSLDARIGGTSSSLSSQTIAKVVIDTQEVCRGLSSDWVAPMTHRILY